MSPGLMWGGGEYPRSDVGGGGGGVGAHPQLGLRAVITLNIKTKVINRQNANTTEIAILIACRLAEVLVKSRTLVQIAVTARLRLKSAQTCSN